VSPFSGSYARMVWERRAAKRQMLVVGIVAAGVLVGVTAMSLGRAAGEDARVVESVSVSGDKVTWFRPLLAAENQQKNRCVHFEYADESVVACLQDGGRSKISHNRFKSEYSVPVDVVPTEHGESIELRRSDVMLPPGITTVRFCQEVDCEPATSGTQGAREVAPAVMTSCQAKAPWRVGGVTTDEKIIALTLDDGPGEHSERALAVVNKFDVPVTFFVVGVHAEKQVPLLQEMVDSGHVLANHSYSHLNLGLMTQQQIRDEFSSTNKSITAANGFGSCLMRAPMGLDGGSTVQVARRMGMISVNWNAGAHDYLGLGKDRIIADTLALVKEGSIVVLHDGGPRAETVAALPKIIKKLRADGYRFVTVPELLNLEATYR
jgi:peptidoglycan/xylan/chitin deacetylase (PgdA/CDA1 family)